MRDNALTRLGALGQSLWLDYIRRDLIREGGLRRLIEEDGLKGVTSNPSIIADAILGGALYDADIQELASRGRTSAQIAESLALCDVAGAADEFRQVYHGSEGRDGYVSIEVDPRLARDARGAAEAGRRLWRELGRPNVMIKIPGTAEGLGAIEELVREGINVNVTLLFGLGRYAQAAEAYIAGLESRAAQGRPVNLVASVASFFVSRIDSAVDPMLDRLSRQGGDPGRLAHALRGAAAVANAKAAYRIYREIFDSPRFRKLAERGARPQRLLWASTGTKDPAYGDVKYVDALIGPETVVTVPRATLDAYRDHGDPMPRLEKDLDAAYQALRSLGELGVRMDEVSRRLEEEGIEKFVAPTEKLLRALEERRLLKAA